RNDRPMACPRHGCAGARIVSVAERLSTAAAAVAVTGRAHFGDGHLATPDPTAIVRRDGRSTPCSGGLAGNRDDEARSRHAEFAGLTAVHCACRYGLAAYVPPRALRCRAPF